MHKDMCLLCQEQHSRSSTLSVTPFQLPKVALTFHFPRTPPALTIRSYSQDRVAASVKTPNDVRYKSFMGSVLSPKLSSNSL